nr:MAG TPA: hypothetical protein [Caudoviricetes sp.]
MSGNPKERRNNMATTAELEELAYNILFNESGNDETAERVKHYYANCLRFDTCDHIIARGMIHTYEDGWDDGFRDGRE